jgi:hypothetical protein
VLGAAPIPIKFVGFWRVWMGLPRLLGVLRGSGLFVGEQGVVTNHHFLPPKDGSAFKFVAGIYKLEIFATRVDQSDSQLLWTIALELTQSMIDHIDTQPSGGVYFNW